MKLQFVMQILILPVVILGIWLGIEYLVYGMIFNGLIGYLLFSKFAGDLTGYHIKEQMIDLAPGFIVAILMGIGVYFISLHLDLSAPLLLFLQVFFGAAITVTLSEIFKNKNYLEIKAILKNLVE